MQPAAAASARKSGMTMMADPNQAGSIMTLTRFMLEASMENQEMQEMEGLMASIQMACKVSIAPRLFFAFPSHVRNQRILTLMDSRYAGYSPSSRLRKQ